MGQLRGDKAQQSNASPQQNIPPQAPTSLLHSLQPRCWISALPNWLMLEKETLNFEYARNCLCGLELLTGCKRCLNVNAHFSMHVRKWMITSLSAATFTEDEFSLGCLLAHAPPSIPAYSPETLQFLVTHEPGGPQKRDWERDRTKLCLYTGKVNCSLRKNHLES